jgi:hypothetical protein
MRGCKKRPACWQNSLDKPVSTPCKAVLVIIASLCSFWNQRYLCFVEQGRFAVLGPSGFLSIRQPSGTAIPVDSATSFRVIFPAVFVGFLGFISIFPLVLE